MSEKENSSISLDEADFSPDGPRLETPPETKIPAGIKRESIFPEQRKPASPGKILKKVYLKPLDLTQQELADKVGVSRRLINEIVNEKRNITPRTALKLAKALQTSPMFWINLQNRFELWQLRQDEDLQEELKEVENVA